MLQFHMDNKKSLILINTQGEWKDKTDSVTDLSFHGTKTKVKFTNGKEYRYNSENVKYLDKPENIDLNRNIITTIYSSGSKSFDDAIRFENYVCLFSKRKKTLEKYEDLIIKKNLAHDPKSKDLINYYTSIANLVKSTKDKDGNTGPVHLDQYYQQKLKQISPDSVLNNFINGVTAEPSLENEPEIFPFGTNISQRSAVSKALKNKISLIEGPPGTGKTQTILNIIANLMMQNKTVAVVAGNNSAVSNVYEKLEKEKLHFIAAKLGSSEAADQFFEQENIIPDISQWELSEKNRKTIKDRLVSIDKNITILLQAKNSLAKKQTFLRQISLEAQYFKENFKGSPYNISQYSFSNKWGTPKLLKFIAEFEHCTKDKSLTPLTKLLWLVKYGIYNFKGFSDPNKKIFHELMSEYYAKRTVELQKDINSLEKKLEKRKFEELLEKKTKYSKFIFKDFIFTKFSKTKENKFNKLSYKRGSFNDFIKRFPVVMSTTDSIINNKPNLELFDYVIVDEASQVNLLTGFLTMACAQNIIVVGDLKQLPHISAEIEQLDDLAQQYNIDPCYNYESENLLSSLDKIFKDIPKTLLREHYRCHPQIIDYCNQKFYGGKLITMTESKGNPFSIIKTAKGNHAGEAPSGSGFINERELQVIEEEILPKEMQNVSAENIGIISPYRSQANKAHEKWKGIGIESDTVHKFQGREKDTIIFSATANKITRFVDDPKLLNVTVSRAKNRFVVVMSQNMIKQQGTNVGDLIRHIEYQSTSPEITESKIVSIFDCLYSEFSSALNKFRVQVKRNSLYLSEDLMATLLDDLLNCSEYASFKYERDYPLKLLVKDNILLTEEEKLFTERSSHVDFLIYNKLDKLPILAIEVDGYSTHALNKKQLKRDKIKNSILKKMELPLERFLTKGSNEKDKLNQILSEIISSNKH